MGGLATHPSAGKEGKSGGKTMGWLSKSLAFKKTKQPGAPSENGGNGVHTPAVEPQSQDTLTPLPAVEPQSQSNLTPPPASPGSAQGPFSHPGGNPGANLKSISHRCHPILVAFVWELTKETIDLPLGCHQGGLARSERQGALGGLVTRKKNSSACTVWVDLKPRW